MTHLLVRDEHAPHEPDRFIALCGYRSETKKEFTSNTGKITCAECLKQLGIKS